MKLRSNGKQADTMQKISEQANSLMQTLAEQAATTAVASKDRAREVSATVVSAAKERAPDRAELSDQVSAVQQKFSEDVVPTAREVALQAASIAIDLWHAGRAKAAEAAESSRQGVVAQAKHEAGRRAHGATSAVTDRASAVTD